MRYRTAALLTAGLLPFTQLACSDDEPANAVPDDVWTVVEQYTAAWNDYDDGAFLEHVTEDYVFITDTSESDRDAQAEVIGAGSLSGMGWSAEVIGDPIVAGDGPYDVAVTNRVTMNGIETDGLSMVTVVDDDGELKVAEHIWTG